MIRWMNALILATTFLWPCKPGVAEEAVQKGQWGPLVDMAGHDWVAVHDGMPTTIVKFRWEKPGQLLVVTGLNRSGATFKGQYELQPETGQIQLLNRRGGNLYRSDYKPTADGFVEEGQQDGVQVRRIYRRVSETTFISVNQSLVAGVWQTTRNAGTFIEASPEWTKELGWQAKDVEQKR